MEPMRFGFLVILSIAACTSTRQVADHGDLRLRSPGHRTGFTMKTESMWKSRVDPNTGLRFHSVANGWSDWALGRALHVDADGVWVDREYQLAMLEDRVRVEKLTPALAHRLEAVRPDGAVLEHVEAETYRLHGQGDRLSTWLEAYEMLILGLRLDDQGAKPCQETVKGPRPTVTDACVELHRARAAGPRMGDWFLYTKHGWSSAMKVHVVAEKLKGGGVSAKAGWRWDEIDKIEVRNISGGKTYAAILLTSAVAVALAPVALLVRGGSIASGKTGGSSGSGGSGGGAGSALRIGGGGADGETKTDTDWEPAFGRPHNEKARPLFSIGSRVRSIVRPTLALDGSAATRGDYYTTGVIGRLRFAELVDIGGGLRMTESLRNDGRWTASRTGVFQLGMHLPFDAAHHVAGLLGFEIGGGKTVETDFRLTWGTRFSSGRWFATVNPGSPSYMRRDDRKGRWSLASGLEIGAGF
jgi:hypothetical protein